MSRASRERKDALAAAHERYAGRRGRDVRDAEGDLAALDDKARRGQGLDARGVDDWNRKNDRRKAAESDVKSAEDTAKALRRRRWWE